jgi:hypothetical protein
LLSIGVGGRRVAAHRWVWQRPGPTVLLFI